MSKEDLQDWLTAILLAAVWISALLGRSVGHPLMKLISQQTRDGQIPQGIRPKNQEIPDSGIMPVSVKLPK